MKALRYTLQAVFIIACLASLVLSLSYAGAFEEYVTPNEVQYLLVYAPTAFTTTVIALLLTFILPISSLALVSFVIPLISAIGCLLKGKSKFLYRVLTYPVLVISLLLAGVFVGGAGLVSAGAYIIVAVAIDALP